MNIVSSLEEEKQFMKHTFTLFKKVIEKNKLKILNKREKNQIILEHYELLNDMYSFINTEIQHINNINSRDGQDRINDNYLGFHFQKINQKMNQHLADYNHKKYQEIKHSINEIICFFENQELLDFIYEKPYVYQIYHYYTLAIYIGYLLTSHKPFIDYVSSYILQFS